jgi:tellurite resistance protein TerC
VWHWVAFAILVVVMLTLDLFVFHRHDHTPSLRESALWTVFWIGTGLAFNVTGYVVEKSLSMDNIFVFVVIFRFFHIPMMYQYRVLFWGIMGAVVMRLVFILAGIELILRFAWVAPIFGAFLIYTAYKLAMHGNSEVHPEKNIILKTARRFFRVSKGDHHQHGHHFFVREAGLLCITPMFLVLLVIESTDVVFAVDSVPAIIGITKDRFLAFTSNIFAILGLRALYFLLAGFVDMFCYLHYGLAAVLGFVGVKMIGEYYAKEGTHLISPLASLGVITVLLGVSIVASLMVGRGATTKDEG